MLTPVEKLTPPDLAAIRALEKRVVAHDGGRLKLEYGVLEDRAGDQVEDLLWWEGDQLVGFLGIYAFGPPDVELAGMVDPAFRRRGIGAALLEAALPLSRGRDYRKVLLVCSPAGVPFAQAKGASPDHSEHFLVLGETPSGDPIDPTVTLRQATVGDIPDLKRILQAAFDWEPQHLEDSLLSAQDQTLVIDRGGVAVGTVRLSRFEGIGGVYGFAVDPALQGQGIGRDVLARVCRQLRDEGLARVTLEVAVDNAKALRLYTSTGFVQEATEDYWAIPLV